jgi:glycosyltransferase involved in cell wall biosynthesis
MERNPPRVTLGMPVYNGDQFLASALESVLCQSFQDFELVISDNASTDRTAEICRDYEARDCRIRYSRNAKNIGLVGNHNRLVELARGEFFMWVAHDDALDKDYVAKCVQSLDSCPDAILCCSHVRDIVEDDISPTPDGGDGELAEILKTDSPDPRVRYRSIIKLNHQCQSVYGVIRIGLLRKTRLHGKYADSDRVFLAELAVRGRFLVVPEPLFFHREHQQRSVHAYRSRQERTVLMDPSQAGKIVYPYWREFFEFLCCVHLSPLPMRERLSCYWETIRWMKQYRRNLFSDLIWAARVVALRVLPAFARDAIKRAFLKSSQNL